MILFFSHSFNTFDFDKHLFTGISMVICKIGLSIRSWLSDCISFSFYKSYSRHDIYWILVAFVIATSALIKVSRLYGLYRHLYTHLIYCHCAVILYTMWIHWIKVSESRILESNHQDLYSLSGKTSYRQISRSLEAARLDVTMVVSLWNSTGTSAALLPRYLPNFRAIGKV